MHCYTKSNEKSKNERKIPFTIAQKKWEQGKKDDGREILLTNNSVHQKW